MKRSILMAALVFCLSAGTASADYVLIKINLNQLSFFPNAAPGAQMGGMGGVQPQPQPFPQPQPGGMGGVQPQPQPFPGGKGGVQPFPGGMGGVQPYPGGMGGVQPQPGMGGGFGAAGGDGGIKLPPFGGGIGGGIKPPVIPEGTPEDPNPRWVSGWIQAKFIENKFGEPHPVGVNPGVGLIFQFDHKWGKKNWMPLSPYLQGFAGRVKSDTHAKDFDKALSKEKSEKVKNVENFIELARKALARGYLKDMHAAMKEAASADPKHPVVKTYQKVSKELAKAFKEEDPAQQDLIRDLQNDGRYKPYVSDQGHYCIYANYDVTDKVTEAAVKRRLVLMEHTLETFYYYFALQKVDGLQPNPPQPAMPKYRLVALLTNTREEFVTRQQQWGGVSILVDGFTPRRDNIMILSAKPRVMDPNYEELDRLLTDKIQEANTKLSAMGASGVRLTRDDLLTGKINEMKGASQVAMYVGAAQVAVVLCKSLEEQAERATVSNHAIRQLLTASGMFPRNVQIPDWTVEGLAALFETPIGALYPRIGEPSWEHLVNFRHLCTERAKKDENFRPTCLHSVVTDRYFQEARKLAAESSEDRENAELRLQSRDAWEMARSTSWAFVYYLAQTRKLDRLFKYGKELDALPRDMDLSDMVMQRSFAKSFAMTDPKDGKIERLELVKWADSWFKMMQMTNLEIPDVQKYYLDELANREAAPGSVVSPKTPDANKPPGKKSPPFNPNPNPSNPPPFNPNPNPPPINPNPMPPPINPNPMPPPINPNPVNPNPMPPMPQPPIGQPPMPPIGQPPMPQPNPNPNPQQPAGLTGIWSGSETLAGFGKLTFQFNAGGQVIMTDAEGVTPGTYNQNGNSVVLTFPGNVSYTGTLNGRTLQGTATNGQRNWNWSVMSAGGGGAVQPPVQPRPMNPKKKGPFG